MARLQNCYLPIILCAENEGRYSLVGEVVVGFERYKSPPGRPFVEVDILAGFSFPRANNEEECEEEQDGDQDGGSLIDSIHSNEGDKDRCWYGVEEEPWTELELI